MYFYRLLTIEELVHKKIHNNKHKFSDCVNTHKYIRGKNYIHLFLNAESCFEDFEKEKYDKCYVAKFNIPDDIVCKYGIGLGGYSPIYNSYNRKYRTINTINNFWLPEIAIPEASFNYDWCEAAHLSIDKTGNCYLPSDFITDELYYREIVYDGYLLGYKDENQLLAKYRNMIEIKKFIIDVLTTTKKININLKNVNDDSILAYYSLVNYAKENKFIDNISEITVSVSENIDNDAINITTESDLNTVISKQFNYSNPTFCSRLEVLGIKVDYDTLINNVDIIKIKKLSL